MDAAEVDKVSVDNISKYGVPGQICVKVSATRFMPAVPDKLIELCQRLRILDKVSKVKRVWSISALAKQAKKLRYAALAPFLRKLPKRNMLLCTWKVNKKLNKDKETK
jgi:hypothetical protein